MKIDPKHDYKKPLYAAGIATLIGATALFGTACGPQIAGGMDIVETEVQLEGEAQTVETEESEETDAEEEETEAEE